MYVFVEKYRKLSLNYPCYPILSGALDPSEVSILQTGCILDMNLCFCSICHGASYLGNMKIRIMLQLRVKDDYLQT